MNRRRRALAAGFAVTALYGGLAAWSGQLSPLARGPLLDGLAPVSYRWVDPPPELASTNQRPASGVFSLTLGSSGVKGQVVFTTDNQTTVIVAPDSIAPAPGQRTVELEITPLDPATLPPPGGDLSVFGNAHEIRATYQPSGRPVTKLQEALDVILLYPATATLHSANHEMLYMKNETAPWKPLDSTDSLQQQQSEANVPGFGHVVVAGTISASPAPADENERSTVAIVLLVLAGCAFLLGIGLLLRSRR